jgi:hypothetical protein
VLAVVLKGTGNESFVDFKENIIKTLQIFTDCKPLEILRR